MLQKRLVPGSVLKHGMLVGTLLSAMLFSSDLIAAQVLAQSSTAPTVDKSQQPHKVQNHSYRSTKKAEPVPAPVAQTPPPPPLPDWPVNNKPNPASVVWDSTGLRINASNSSLQQILNEVSTETGSKIEGSIPDQRVYGNFGPGQARDVLSQLLQGSGFNILLAGDIGQGAPRQIVLSQRHSGSSNGSNTMNRPQQEPDEDVSEDQPEEQPQPQPPIQQPQMPNLRPGFGPNGPNGPIRTPQQVMEEMQQRQVLQQQQIQQQQANPPQ